MIKKILIVPDKLLNSLSTEVDLKSDKEKKEVKEIAQNLIDTLKASKIPGAGLAAPQIGVLKRVILVRKFFFEGQIETHKDIIMINPKIVKRSKEKARSVEACLSIPQVFGFVERNKKLVIEFFDTDFKKRSLGASNYFSFVTQHEIDHLNGVLFTSKLIDDKKYTEKEIDKILNKEE